MSCVQYFQVGTVFAVPAYNPSAVTTSASAVGACFDVEATTAPTGPDGDLRIKVDRRNDSIDRNVVLDRDAGDQLFCRNVVSVLS